MPAPVILVIRDGWGINPGRKAKAKEKVSTLKIGVGYLLGVE